MRQVMQVNSPYKEVLSVSKKLISINIKVIPATLSRFSYFLPDCVFELDSQA